MKCLACARHRHRVTLLPNTSPGVYYGMRDKQCLDHETGEVKELWGRHCFFSKCSDTKRETLWPGLVGRKESRQLNKVS